MAARVRLKALGFAPLLIFSIASVVGYAAFGLNPALLARFPGAADFYPTAFPFFARGHILLAFATLAVSLSARVGLKWLPAFFVACSISLGAELLGTATGIPFSAYRYTEFLGYKVLGLVPALIPISWFMMAFPSYVIAQSLARRPLARWGFGALLLTTWDLTLDPAMSELTPYWVWETPGPYYGMPLVNLLGWFATGVAIMAGFDLARANRIARRIPVPLMEAYYLIVLALSVAMTLVGGLWGAAAATAVVLGLVKWKQCRTPRAG